MTKVKKRGAFSLCTPFNHILQAHVNFSQEDFLPLDQFSQTLLLNSYILVQNKAKTHLLVMKREL